MRTKLFFVLIITLIPLVSAAFILSVTNIVTPISPFTVSQATIHSAYNNTIVAGGNFTETWTLTNSLAQPITIQTAPTVSNTTAIHLFGTWPQLITIPGSGLTTVTATFEAMPSSVNISVTITLSGNWIQ